MDTAPHARVLMVVENNPYPQDTRVRREAEALAHAGYQVSVIAPAGRGQDPREIVGDVHVYRYPAPRAGDGVIGYAWEYGYSLARILVLSALVFRRRGFDILHVANPPDLLALISLFYRPLGRKMIFDHHDLAPEMFDARFTGRGPRQLRDVLIFFERVACRLAERVLTTNEQYRTVVMKRARIRADRISIVRNGPDAREVAQVLKGQRAKQDNKRTIVGYVGIFGPQDGVDRLLRAVAHLRHDFGRPDVHCLLIGDGSEGTRLRFLARKLDIDQAVEFTGFLPHLEAMQRLSDADIGVVPDPSNPYNDRSTMIKLLDYMALGIPTVAFDLPEHHASADGAARYVPPNDDLQLALGIASLIDDPDAQRRMAAIGRERIDSALSWQHSIPHLLAAYDSLAVPLTADRRGASA